MQNSHVQKTVSSFSTATYHPTTSTPEKFYNAGSHKTSHRLCVSTVVSLVGWLWRSRKKTKLNSLHRRADKLILPDPSLSTVTERQKMSVLGILTNLPQKLAAYNLLKEYLCTIKVLIIIPQITAWPHNSLLVTSPTTLTPGISSKCQGQGLTYLKLVYPSLERLSGLLAPKYKLMYFSSLFQT